jgi:hypothetical protein
MTSSHPPDPAALRETLQRSEPGVRYDVDAGLARHRELVAGAAPLPEWARSLPVGRRFGQLWLISSLALMGALSFLLLRAEPSSSSPADALALAAAGSRAPPASVHAAPSPSVQPLPSVQVPASTSSAATPATPAPPGAKPEAALEAALRASPVVAAPRASAPTRSATRVTAAPRAALVPAAPAPNVAPLPDDLIAELTQGAPAGAASTDAVAPEPIMPLRSPPPEAIDPLVIEEMQQLATAERLLATMPSRTLSMVREGMQRFPRGYLAQERRYLEIMALLALHMPKDAELLSRGFLREYPNGPYRRKIERALEQGAASE